MNKTVLMPIGYDIGGILRALSDHQLQSKDKFIFVIPATETDRTRVMKAEIEQSLSVLASRGIKLGHEFVTVDENDFAKTFSALIKKMVAERGREVVIEIAGGLRIIGLTLLLAACALPNLVRNVYAIAESSSRRVSIPLPRIRAKMGLSSVVLVKELGRGLDTLDQLSQALAKDKSTLDRQIRRLVEDGLVEQVREGRTLKYSLTLFGLACLASLGDVSR